MGRKGMPLHLETAKPEDQFTNVNPFHRELIRKQIVSYKKKMYKIIEEGFFYGVGGIMHFWLWHAVLSSHYVPITYFVLLSKAKWMKEQRDRDTFTAVDLKPCGVSPNQITLLLRSGKAKGHIARAGYGKYKITSLGSKFTTLLTNEMYRLVVDLYDPDIKKT